MMRRFIYRVLLFFAAGIVIVLFLFYIIYFEADIRKLIGYEVYHSIIKAEQKPRGVKKLIIGDSVCKQLYDNFEYNDSLYSLACNQAISMVGQYILLDAFLKNYTESDLLEVVLIYRPSSFRNNLDQSYTFNYFLKPFYFKKNDVYFSPLVKGQIKNIPNYYLVKIPFIRKSRWSSAYNRKGDDPNNFTISAISAQYLMKMHEICIQNRVRSFTIICPYMSNQFQTEDFKSFDDEVRKYGLTDFFKGYYDSIVFLEKELFIDGIHLKKPGILGNNYLNL